MPRTRKTVEVATVLTAANHFLEVSRDDQSGERRGVAGLLETVLFQSGNYAGFNYRGADNRAGELDDSRRIYHAARR